MNTEVFLNSEFKSERERLSNSSGKALEIRHHSPIHINTLNHAMAKMS